MISVCVGSHQLFQEKIIVAVIPVVADIVLFDILSIFGVSIFIVVELQCKLASDLVRYRLGYDLRPSPSHDVHLWVSQAIDLVLKGWRRWVSECECRTWVPTWVSQYDLRGARGWLSINWYTKVDVVSLREMIFVIVAQHLEFASGCVESGPVIMVLGAKIFFIACCVVSAWVSWGAGAARCRRKCRLDGGLCYTCQVIVPVRVRGIAHIYRDIAGCWWIYNSNLEGVLDCAWDKGSCPLLLDLVLKSVDSDLTRVCQGSRFLL